MTSRPPNYPGSKDIRKQFQEAIRGPVMEPGPEPGLEPEFEIPSGPYVHVAEYIPVREWGQVWPFMKRSMEIYRHSRECPGFLAGGIRGKWWRRQFWSYTVWSDRESMVRFVHSAPHAEAARLIGHFAAPGACYVEWSSMSPPDWPEAMERLKIPTKYFVPPGVR